MTFKKLEKERQLPYKRNIHICNMCIWTYTGVYNVLGKSVVLWAKRFKILTQQPNRPFHGSLYAIQDHN